MARPANYQPSSQELLERGRLALQAIEYDERAARYQAAAARLKAAMVQAENGDVENLSKWLELESYRFDGGVDLCIQEVDAEHRVAVASRIGSEAEWFGADAESIGPDASSIGADAGSIRHGSWERMEKAAGERLAKARSKSPFKYQPDSQASESGDALRIVISSLKDPEKSTAVKHWWNAPHVLVSLLVHAVLIVCLGLFAISVAQEPRLLSIVSASVEAENVLLESPMEMVSELEAAVEPLQSLLMPNLSHLDTTASFPDAFIETDLSVSSSAASFGSDSVQASMIGSKILAGAEFFGIKATGNTFVYIVDSSPSMRRDGAFEAARKEIVRSLTSMKPKQRYFISFFGKEIDPMVLEFGVVERFPVYAKPENLTKTMDWMSRVQVQKEGLPPNNALSEAIGMQPDGIFLLFDGDTKADVAKFLRRVNRSDDILTAGIPKVPIHVIHFFQDSFQKHMRQIAEENGGTYRFVPRPERPSKGNR